MPDPPFVNLLPVFLPLGDFPFPVKFFELLPLLSSFLSAEGASKALPLKAAFGVPRSLFVGTI